MPDNYPHDFVSRDYSPIYRNAAIADIARIQESREACPVCNFYDCGTHKVWLHRISLTISNRPFQSMLLVEQSPLGFHLDIVRREPNLRRNGRYVNWLFSDRARNGNLSCPGPLRFERTIFASDFYINGRTQNVVHFGAGTIRELTLTLPPRFDYQQAVWEFLCRYDVVRAMPQ